MYYFMAGTESAMKPSSSARKTTATAKPAVTTTANTNTNTAPVQPATPMSVDSSSDDDEATDSDSGAVAVKDSNSSSGDVNTGSWAAAARAALLDANNNSGNSAATADVSARSGSGDSATAAASRAAKAKATAPVTTTSAVAAAVAAPVTPTATAATGEQERSLSGSGSSSSDSRSSGNSSSSSNGSGGSAAKSIARFEPEVVAGDDSTSVPWQSTKAATAESTISTTSTQQQQQQQQQLAPVSSAVSATATAVAAAATPTAAAAAGAQLSESAAAALSRQQLHQQRLALQKVHAAQSDLYECITATPGVRELVRQLRQQCLRSSSSSSSVTVAVVTAAYEDDAVVPVAQLQCEFAAMTELLQRTRTARTSAETRKIWFLQLLLHSGMLGATAVAAGRTGNITDSAAVATAHSVHELQERLVQTIEQNDVVQQPYKDALIRGVLAVTDLLLSTATSCDNIAAAAFEPVSALRALFDLREQLIAVVQAAAKALPEVRDMLTLRLLTATKAGSAAIAQQRQLQQGGVAALNRLSAAALALHFLQQRALSHIDSCASSVSADRVEQWQLCVLTDPTCSVPQLMQFDGAPDEVYASELSNQQALVDLIENSTGVSEHVRERLKNRLLLAGVW
jgi:hypothetical protein